MSEDEYDENDEVLEEEYDEGNEEMRRLRRGLPRTVRRQASLKVQNQGDYGTCWAFTVSRILSKVIKQFFHEEFAVTTVDDCNYEYNMIMGLTETELNSEHTLRSILSKICKNPDGLDVDKRINAFSIYYYILTVAVNMFGCGGVHSFIATLKLFTTMIYESDIFFSHYNGPVLYKIRTEGYIRRFIEKAKEKKIKFGIYKFYTSTFPEWISRIINKNLYIAMGYRTRPGENHAVTVTNYYYKSRKIEAINVMNSWGNTDSNMIFDEDFVMDKSPRYVFIDYSTDPKKLDYGIMSFRDSYHLLQITTEEQPEFIGGNEEQGPEKILFPNGQFFVGRSLNKRFKTGFISYTNGDLYEGSMKYGIKEYCIKDLYGEMHYANDDRYIGHWENDVKMGKGTMVYANGQTYTGNWENDKKVGEGTMQYANGDKYTGHWENDVKVGEGEMQYANGDKYTGHWENDKKVGEGTMQYANRDKYTGHWENDKKVGEGTMFYANGGKYTGHWENDVKMGQGTMVRAKETYTGNWENDVKMGEGVMDDGFGNKYTGHWENDVKWGEGIQTYNNGDFFRGTWENDVTVGKAEMRYGNGDVYKGDWGENDVKVGEGEMQYANGDKYDGHWENDVKMGVGEMWYANGDEYTGHWENDVKVGVGYMEYANGDTYDGHWENDVRVGKGEMKYANGDKYIGHWDNDVKVGEGTMRYANGDTCNGHWENDVKVGECERHYVYGDIYAVVPDGNPNTEEPHGLATGADQPRGCVGCTIAGGGKTRNRKCSKRGYVNRNRSRRRKSCSKRVYLKRNRSRRRKSLKKRFSRRSRRVRRPW